MFSFSLFCKEEEDKEGAKLDRSSEYHDDEFVVFSITVVLSSSGSAFVEFFAHLSAEKINHLYTISPWATLAVLRALTPLAKQYIMRCVFLPRNSVIAHEMLAFVDEARVRNSARDGN